MEINYGWGTTHSGFAGAIGMEEGHSTKDNGLKFIKKVVSGPSRSLLLTVHSWPQFSHLWKKNICLSPKFLLGIRC